MFALASFARFSRIYIGCQNTMILHHNLDATNPFSQPGTPSIQRKTSITASFFLNPEPRVARHFPLPASKEPSSPDTPVACVHRFARPALTHAMPTENCASRRGLCRRPLACMKPTLAIFTPSPPASLAPSRPGLLAHFSYQAAAKAPCSCGTLPRAHQSRRSDAHLRRPIDVRSTHCASTRLLSSPAFTAARYGEHRD